MASTKKKPEGLFAKLRGIRKNFTAMEKRQRKEQKQLDAQHEKEARKLAEKAEALARKNKDKVSKWAKHHPKAAYETGLGVVSIGTDEHGDKKTYRPAGWLDK